MLQYRVVKSNQPSEKRFTDEEKKRREEDNENDIKSYQEASVVEFEAPKSPEKKPGALEKKPSGKELTKAKSSAKVAPAPPEEAAAA